MTNAEKLEQLADIRTSLDRVYAVVVDYFDQHRKGKRPLLRLEEDEEGKQLILLTNRDEYRDLPPALCALRRARPYIDEEDDSTSRKTLKLLLSSLGQFSRTAYQTLSTTK